MINLNALQNSAVKLSSRSLLVVKKYSPEILTSVGVVGVVASAVFASKATLHLEPIVDNMRALIEVDKEQLEGELISKEDHVKNVATIYTRTTIEIAKLYGPTLTLGLSSIGCIIAAHGIMKKRNVALVAAYKTVESAFAKYRERVVEELGEDKDRDFRLGLRHEEVKDEKGKVTTVTTVDPNGISGYAKFFDEYNGNWTNNPESNLSFLKCQQNFANDKLRIQGHLFLNDVYQSLGMEHTSAGAVVGWYMDKDGDNFVDFGIYNFMNSAARSFVNGDEASILLDFNVDGVIFDKLGD